EGHCAPRQLSDAAAHLARCLGTRPRLGRRGRSLRGEALHLWALSRCNLVQDL
ncbi:unnamed protein product, partial [Cladocopium goreaui]